MAVVLLLLPMVVVLLLMVLWWRHVGALTLALPLRGLLLGCMRVVVRGRRRCGVVLVHLVSLVGRRQSVLPLPLLRPALLQVLVGGRCMLAVELLGNVLPLLLRLRRRKRRALLGRGCGLWRLGATGPGGMLPRRACTGCTQGLDVGGGELVQGA